VSAEMPSVPILLSAMSYAFGYFALTA